MRVAIVEGLLPSQGAEAERDKVFTSLLERDGFDLFSLEELFSWGVSAALW